MVIRQGEDVLKAHVCLDCFETAEALTPDVESVSLQDYEATIEHHLLAPGAQWTAMTAPRAAATDTSR